MPKFAAVPPSDADSRPVPLPEVFARWFAARGWSPRAHQLALLDKARQGRSALLIAPTGAGKTLAGFLPTLVELSESSAPARAATVSTGRAVRRSGGLQMAPCPLMGTLGLPSQPRQLVKLRRPCGLPAHLPAPA